MRVGIDAIEARVKALSALPRQELPKRRCPAEPENHSQQTHLII
jgi:hypothetical protein